LEAAVVTIGPIDGELQLRRHPLLPLSYTRASSLHYRSCSLFLD